MRHTFNLFLTRQKYQNIMTEIGIKSSEKMFNQNAVIIEMFQKLLWRCFLVDFEQSRHNCVQIITLRFFHVHYFDWICSSFEVNGFTIVKITGEMINVHRR